MFITVIFTSLILFSQVHTDLCVSLVQSQQQALLGLQESSSRIISQQTETAQHTAAAARHIREVKHTHMHVLTHHSLCTLSYSTHYQATE